MREYELAVVFDLALAEADGQEAGPQTITTLVEARQGSVVKVDHWGRRRMAYPIKGMLDADYVITRVMLEPTQVREIETALKLNERVLRHLVVRADELPIPRQREEPPAPEARAEPPAAAMAPIADAATPVEAPADATTPAPEAPAAVEPAVDAVDATAPVAEAPAAVETAVEADEAADDTETAAETAEVADDTAAEVEDDETPEEETSTTA